MNTLPTHHERGVAVVISLPEQEPLLEAVARLALGGDVQLIIGGNRFDAHRLARIMRGYTIYVNQALARIQLSRPFTCYQSIALLQQMTAVSPCVILDMLTTFYDDNISDQESIRLVMTAASHLHRLGQQMPVLVTLRTSTTRQKLAEIVCEAADQVFIYEPPPAPQQRSFW